MIFALVSQFYVYLLYSGTHLAFNSVLNVKAQSADRNFQPEEARML